MTETGCVHPDIILQMMIHLILSSEVGVLDIASGENCSKRKICILARCFWLISVKGRVIDDEELKETYASRQPYGEWLDNNLIELKDLKIPNQRVSVLYGRRMQKTSESIWIFL